MSWASAQEVLAREVPDRNTALILAASGGVDSQVLMSWLAGEGYGRVHCVYCDHGLRDDTVQDWQAVEELTARLGYTAEKVVLHLDAGNMENSARKARYAALEMARQQYGATWILTAHHGDDLIESQIMHMVRGSGLAGMVGLRESDGTRHLLRPLLGLDKAALQLFADEHHLSWNEDTTNADTTLGRNHVRHRLLPLLRTLQPDMLHHARALSVAAAEHMDFLTRSVEQHLGRFLEKHTCSYWEYYALDPVLQKHWLLLLLRAYTHTYTAARIDSLHTALLGYFPSGSTLPLTGDLWLERSFETLYLRHKNDNTTLPVPSMVMVPKDAPILHRISLRASQRVRCYRRREDGTFAIWHTTVKKWRMQQQIPHWEASTMEGLATEEKEIIAILHPLWHYPSDLATSLIPVPDA